MRLISQDGKCDIPYDTSPLYIFKSCDEWQVRTAATILGHYSTEEKALKVMEIVRTYYASYLKSEVISYAFIQPKVFQFPKDEEVEV